MQRIIDNMPIRSAFPLARYQILSDGQASAARAWPRRSIASRIRSCAQAATLKRRCPASDAHNCLNFVVRETGLIRSWRFRCDGADLDMTPAGDMSFNDGGALFVAACAGYGIAQLQDYFADEAIAAGRLEPVLEKFKPAATPISVVYPATGHLSSKVRAFVDFLIAQFPH
jgi:DNA-binding transcriptional LysR family regulator